MDIIKNKILEIIKLEMFKRKITQSQLAGLLGCTQGTLAVILSNKRGSRTDKLSEILKVLSIEIEITKIEKE